MEAPSKSTPDKPPVAGQGEHLIAIRVWLRTDGEIRFVCDRYSLAGILFLWLGRVLALDLERQGLGNGRFSGAATRHDGLFIFRVNRLAESLEELCKSARWNGLSDGSYVCWFDAREGIWRTREGNPCSPSLQSDIAPEAVKNAFQTMRDNLRDEGERLGK
jgi:hypothetical protein